MTKNDLIDCHDRIKPFIHNTPVLTSKLINNLTGADIYFKCENFQKMGAFKMRGAANAILKLSDEQKNNGVVTHSSGNHAQAISLAAKKIGIKAYIIMPSNAPEIKKIAVITALFMYMKKIFQLKIHLILNKKLILMIFYTNTIYHL